MKERNIKKMNRIDKVLVNAKVRADVVKDAFCERFLSKKNGDSDIISKVIFMVVIIALVLAIKWAVSYLLTGSIEYNKSSANTGVKDGILGKIKNSLDSIFSNSGM